MPYALVLIGILVGWLALHAKSARPDGTVVPVHPYRRLMFFIMPTRTESVVSIDLDVRAEALETYLAEAGPAFGADVTHAVVAAVGIALGVAPRMNRFVSGGRLYQRKGRWITFSMKRKQLDRDAKLATVKLAAEDGETFPDLVRRINGEIVVERSGCQTAADREYDLFNLLPRPLLRAGVAALRSVDRYNLLPGAFIASDPLYTSTFVANLGSLAMAPVYHHLYEYGTCGTFVAVGRIEEVPVVRGGAIVAGRRLRVRVTYDERIDDGLNGRYGLDAFVTILEDPRRWLGGLAGAQASPMWPRPDADALEAAAGAMRAGSPRLPRTLAAAG